MFYLFYIMSECKEIKPVFTVTGVKRLLQLNNFNHLHTGASYETFSNEDFERTLIIKLIS